MKISEVVTVKNAYGAFYTVNVVFQAIFTLLWQILLSVFLGFVLVKYAHLPEWVYIPLILLGVGFGFFSMIKFILAATRSLESIERAEKQKRKEKKLNGK